MSDGSSSSRESSPGLFRSRSPGSDNESVGTWQGSSSTLHPSSFQSSNAPLLRQPVAFGANAAPALVYHHPHATPSQHYRSAQNLAEEQSAPPHSSSKGKERERTKDKSKEASRKGKERDKGSSMQAVSQTPYPPSNSSHLPPDAHKKKAFRVDYYSNDPNAGAAPYVTQEGPYGSTFRADVGERVTSHRSQSTTSQPPPQPSRSQTAQSSQEQQPRSSYYRYDYEKLRQNTPANRAKQAAPGVSFSAATPPPPPSSHHSATPNQSYYSTPPPTSSSNPDGHRHSSRSKKRKDTHMHPSDHLYPSAYPQYGDTQEPFPTDYTNSAPPPQYNHFPPSHSPSLAPPPRERRHKSRSHRHERDHAPPTPTPTYHHPSAHPQPPPQPQPPPRPEAPARVCRTLTLLIEDKRDNDGDDSMLTEVRVPLRQMDGGEAGFWADAQDVTNELQNGPSRIDGRAKVYTLRGKYKQYFLRISESGEQVCQSANLKVSPERTLEIFVEDNPPPVGMSLAPPPSSPPRMQRELLTPVTDSMASPSPAPMPPPVSGHKRTSRSSLFSVEDYPSPEEQKFDTSEYPSSPRKRPRSASVQSIQSVHSVSSEGYLQPQPQPHDAYSPFSRRTPSMSASSTSQSRTPSQSSPPPPQQRQSMEPAQTSPVPPLSELPPAQPQSTNSFPRPQSTHSSTRPDQPARVPSSFSQMQSSSSTSTFGTPSAFGSGPSPPKKTKLSVSQPPRHTEHSVSPGPSQPGTYPLSHSRSSSSSNAPVSSGFAAYANMSSKITSTPAPNPFAQYESGAFRLPTPQSETSSTPASQTNLALPSVTAPISVPTIPSLSSVSIPASMPTTMAPSAMTVTPTLSGQASSDLDNAVGKWIRAIIDKEPEWAVFVENRKRVLKVREQLEQYRYVQGIFDRFVGSATPPDLEGAGAVAITRAQVMRAFNLPVEWGEQCTETLVLTGLYGPGGTRGEEGRVVRMLDEPPAITTKITTERYLKLLREVHGQWTVNNPG